MSDEPKSLSGPKILIFGESGSGKTYSIGTLVEWALKNKKEVFYLDIEGSLETLLGFWTDRGKEIPSNLFWCSGTVAPLSMKRIMEGAKQVGDLSYEALTKTTDFNRGGENNPFWRILSLCSDFPDDRTGKKFGSVDTWGLDKIFVLDSFTALSAAAQKMVIGGKPTMSLPDYGVAQNNLLNFLRLCNALKCIFVMTAHPAKDKDEISGATKVTIKTIGTAIQADIPPLFSDMIWTMREASSFTWSTAEFGVVAKTRSLGYKSKISPDFAQILDLWLKRGGK